MSGDKEIAQRMAQVDLPVPITHVYVVDNRSDTRTSSGKKRYSWVRYQYQQGTLDAAHRVVLAEARPQTDDPANRVDTASASGPLWEAICHFLPTGDSARIARETRLREDLGLDSVAIVELGASLEHRVHRRVPPEVLTQASTVGALYVALSAAPVIDVDETGDPPGSNLTGEFFARIPQTLIEVEAQRQRELKVGGRWVVDFASCNYLGLDLHEEVIAAIEPAVRRWGVHPSWTRAVASPAIQTEVERKLAALSGGEHVLCFPTITLLHAGVLPLLAGTGGLWCDNKAHQSIHDAAKLAQGYGAHYRRFRHGDLAALELELQSAAHLPTRIIAVDGVYSMSGTMTDLPALAALAREYDAWLYVDDAHGLGLLGAGRSPQEPWGRGGGGVVQWFGLDYSRDRILYVSGLSKAFSSIGAFIVCPVAAIRHKLQGASTFVFSGPVPIASLATTLAGIDVNVRDGDQLRARVARLTRRLVTGIRSLGLQVDNQNDFPIVTVVLGKPDAVVATCQLLWRHGVLITPALYPAVPLDRGGIRFSVTAANTEEQVERVLRALSEYVDPAMSGVKSSATGRETPVLEGDR